MTKSGFKITRGNDREGNDTFTIEKEGMCHLLFALIKQYGVYGCMIIKIFNKGRPFWMSKHPETEDMKLFLGSTIHPFYTQEETKRINKIL